MAMRAAIVTLAVVLSGCVTVIQQQDPKGASDIKVKRLLELADATEKAGDFVNAERMRREAERLSKENK